jgi:hypothetical protein
MRVARAEVTTEIAAIRNAKHDDTRRRPSEHSCRCRVPADIQASARMEPEKRSVERVGAPFATLRTGRLLARHGLMLPSQDRE